MKIVDAKQMREWDAYTIQHQNISSLDLMERAAQQCTGWITEQDYKNKGIQIICGTGNNGGDGLAIARLLQKSGHQPTVVIADWNEKQSDDFKENLMRLKQTDVEIVFFKTENEFSKISRESIIVDALFGYGLNRSLEGLYVSLIHYINESGAQIISIDIPSGMFADSSSKGNTIIKATETLTFQAMKLCFLMADNADFFGNVHVLPIGLSKDWEETTEAKFILTDLYVASSLYKQRKKFSHKGNYGHALLVAGNEGKMGAAVMCAAACLRSGVGLLTCSLPPSDFSIIHTTIPEAMVTERGKEKDLSKFNVIGAGPGLGTEETTTAFVHSLLQQYKNPMVIDADALNIISEHKDWLMKIPKGSILTPHPKEFDRLWGESKDDWERMNKAIQAAKDNRIVVVLKGAHTLVTDGERNYFNNSGNNGMATGGSGDVLTGLITGLMAQKYLPFEAAVMAVYVHGLAADLCLEDQSFESLLPTDMIQRFGKAFQQVQKNKGA